MREVKVDAQMTGLLARLAGYELFPERCSRLSPEIGWILKEAARIGAIDWTGVEPANVFNPGVWQTGGGKNHLR